MSTSVESLTKRKRSEEELLISTVDTASHLLPSPVKIGTLQNPTTSIPALTQGSSVAEADADVDDDDDDADDDDDDIWIDKSKVLTYKHLQRLTDNFSTGNYMGRTQYGMLYKGVVPDDWKVMRSGAVTIKMWKNERFYTEDHIVTDPPLYAWAGMKRELKFLLQPDISRNPCTVNILGYCLEEGNPGVVYDLEPLQTLAKYIDNDKFGWRDSISVAVKLAHLLKFFHENEPQYIVQNLPPAHVMLDQKLNPVLIDYATIRGGSFDGLTDKLIIGSSGYYYAHELLVGYHTERTDVYAYGVILLEMLRRCRYNSRELKISGKRELIDDYAWDAYGCYRAAMDAEIERGGTTVLSFTLAQKCLRNDPDYKAHDGQKISLLALRCVRTRHIPTIGEVIKELKELKLIQSLPELLLLFGYESRFLDSEASATD